MGQYIFMLYLQSCQMCIDMSLYMPRYAPFRNTPSLVIRKPLSICTSEYKVFGMVQPASVKFSLCISLSVLEIFQVFTMRNKEEDSRIKREICESLEGLCKQRLSFKSNVEIKALVGITIDDGDVVLVIDIQTNASPQQFVPPLPGRVGASVPR